MFKSFSEFQRGIIISFILFLLVMTNYYFNIGSFFVSNFYIVIGFSIGMHLYFGNKTNPYIFVGVLIPHIVGRLLYIDESLLASFSFSIALSLINVLAINTAYHVVNLIKIQQGISLKNILILVTTTIAVCILITALTTTLVIIQGASFDLKNIIINLFLGNFFGIMIFGLAVILAFENDGKLNFSLSKNIQSIIYLAFFIVLTSLLFSGTIKSFTFEHYSFILIFFYLLLSFVFEFRMIMVISIIYSILFQIFNIDNTYVEDYTIILFRAHLFLFILSTTSIIIKLILNNLKSKNKALIESSLKLKSLVYSTDSLLKLSDDILNTDTNIQEDYISRIFEIACNIFDNYDYAACYIRGEKYANFLDARGYDVDVLNSFKFESEKLDFIDVHNPVHISDENSNVKKSFDDKYDEFIKIYPIMSEAIRFGIYIDENTIASLSFDISKASGKKFLKNEFENLKSFQKLMNSFFSMNYLSYKNISLKNDIVLSLIRTLELYDQYTGGHSEEVAHLSNEISKRLGLKENEMHDIYWAGVVHDIGKVGIDSSIINKASKLSLEEYEMIKEHSMFGYDILNKAEDLKSIAVIVKHHHEWWNGAGYPSGLKGNEIPLGSQIISICDAVSTMAKKRPYTIVKTSKEIIEELELYSGVQFAPEPTKHMIQFIEEGHLDKYYKNR